MIGVEISDSAMLGEYIENFDRPEGLSAVIDKKPESDEYLCGKWYSPSCAEEPEYVGDIHVRLLSETAIETQIKFSDDDEWQPPVVLTLQHRERDW